VIFGRKRDWLTFDYYDLSGDKAAWRYTALDDDVEIELRRAGFVPLGVVKAELRAHKQTRLTTQVWVTEDGRVVTNGPLELATLFEDGTIVKTSMRPPRAIFTRERWVLRMHPNDRHPHAFVEGSLEKRLAAHLETVARFEKESRVVPIASMSEYFAVRLRDAELRIARHNPQHVISLWTTSIVSLAVGFLPVIWRARKLGPHKHAFVPHLLATLQLTTLFFLALFIVALPLRALMVTWISPWIVRLRPGPPPRPAADWIELAREIPSGTLKK